MKTNAKNWNNDGEQGPPRWGRSVWVGGKGNDDKMKMKMKTKGETG